MAKKINFETHVVEFYGKSQNSKNAFEPGNKSEELLGTVKFKNESDYRFFKNSFKGFMNGVLYGENVVKASEVNSYKVFECNKFTGTVFNQNKIAA